MPSYAGSVLSYTTAVILIDGVDVGEIQDLSFRQQFNVVDFLPLGQAVPRNFLVGGSVGMGSFRKAYLRPNYFIDKMKPNLALTESTMITQSQKSNRSTFDETSFQFAKILGGKTLSESDAYDEANAMTSMIDGLFSSKINKKFLTLYFDIELRQRMPEQDQKEFKLTDCVFTTRDFTINDSNVVLLENCSFKFKDII